MDPISQGIVGAVCARSVKPRVPARETLVLGALAGMAPDLDVLIRSASDPLLFLEFHRQFTHALAFAPIGALLVSIATLWLFRSAFPDFRTRYWICLAGYASHGLLDAATTYGTQLYFPFSDFRVAWNFMSIVDPLFTLPLIGLSVLAVTFSKRQYHWLGVLWMVGYLSMGVIQRDRAESAGLWLAASRGHPVTEISAKPGFASLLMWKTVYTWGDRFYVDGIRVGLETTFFPGTSVRKLDETWLKTQIPQDSRQWHDVARFRWFSADHLGWSPDRPLEIMDVRYSMLVNRIDPLWVIKIDPDEPDQHVAFVTRRDASPETVKTWWCMLTNCEAPSITSR